jgi:AcrR family transcriptional regulator
VRASASDPRAAILDAAERLCGEHGIEAVSLRDIAEAAGVNLSALNYYFGSRINLLVTILQTRCAEQEQERRQLLHEAGCNDPPELRDIVRAVLLPLARWRQPGSSRNAALQFITRALTTAIPELKKFIDDGVLGFRSVIDLLQQALPALSREELCWRFHFMMSIEHMNVWDVERLRLLSDGLCNAEDGDEALERAVDFAVAAFLAPVRRVVAKRRPAARSRRAGRSRTA